MTHGFFARMGGFVIDTRPTRPEEGEFLHGSPRITVMAAGVLFLARHGCLPDISKEMIADKSKADPIAKSLVCIQAGWLIVQCIARLVSSLPITLLEVATLAHCMSALAMYLLWWHKPLDINEPVVLSHPHIRQMAAFLVEGSSVVAKQPKAWRLQRHDPIKERKFYPLLSTTRQGMAIEASEVFDIPSEEIEKNATPEDEMTPPRIALCAFNWDQSEWPKFVKIMTTFEWLEEESEDASEKTNILGWLAFTFATASYGGIHCAAWFSLFPTTVEALIWRLSSTCVTSSGLVLTTLFRLSDPIIRLVDWSEDYSRNRVILKPLFWIYALGWFIFVIIWASFFGAYVFSRGFLIVEAFISLRHLPVTAYDTPDWTQWLPHL
jgi:hypothetical protein